MKINFFFIFTVICSFLFATSLEALTLFGSKEDALNDRLRAGNKLMFQADSAFESGDFKRAEKYYERAIDKFDAVNKADPDFMEGLASDRIQYCAERYTNAVEALEKNISFGDEGTAMAIPTEDLESKIQDSEEKSQEAAPQAGGSAVASSETTDSEDDIIEEPAPVVPPYDEKNLVHDFNEARTQLEDGNLSEAAAILIPILRHDPSNRQVRLLLAIIRTRQGRYDEAIVALEDLRGRRDDLPILLTLSGAYMSAGRYNDAMLVLDNATKLSPNDPAAYMNLAWLTLIMPDNNPDKLKFAQGYYRIAIKYGATRDRALEKRLGMEKW